MKEIKPSTWLKHMKKKSYRRRGKKKHSMSHSLSDFTAPERSSEAMFGARKMPRRLRASKMKKTPSGQPPSLTMTGIY